MDSRQEMGSLWYQCKERYSQAMASKLYEVEELVDFYFHRRFAAVLAVMVSYCPLRIMPNHITIGGLFLGWYSALCLYASHFPVSFFYLSPLTRYEAIMNASFFMLAWIVSDCADGQVARLCQRGTRTGRILDGLIDGAVVVPNLTVVSKILEAIGYSSSLTIVSGFSLWFHTLTYDNMKNMYMEGVLPISECDGETPKSVYEEYKKASGLDAVLLRIYYHYLRLQTACQWTENRPTSRLSSKKERMEFAVKHAFTMRLASFLGVSAHVVGFYISYFSFYYVGESALLALHFYFIVVLNALGIYVVYLQKKMVEKKE